jgi:hypothetical protein
VVPAELPELAYQLALRALDQQESGLAELRARTNTLLAAASFLAAPAIDRASVGVWVVLVLVVFAVTVALCLFVLIPTSLVSPSTDRGSMKRSTSTRRPARSPAPIRLWLQSFHAANAPKIERRRARLRDAALALGAQILLLSVAGASRCAG